MDNNDDSWRIITRWLGVEKTSIVGRGIVRVDGYGKVCGQTRFLGDLPLEGLLYARLLRATRTHANIVRIDFSRTESQPGYVGAVIAKDITGENQVGYYLSDQPLFADKVVRYYGEPLGLVVARSPELAEDLLETVDVEYEALPAVYDPLEALQSGVLVHPERGTNIAITAKIRKGDIEKGFGECAAIVENTYRVGYQDHAYIEPEGALVTPTNDGITIVSCDQYPHLTQRVVSRVLGWPESSIRVVHVGVGGGFGGKDDMGPIVAAQAAVACVKLRKPVLLEYTREDSLTSHCKRDPAIIRYKSGADSRGRLRAIDVEIVFDSGAYANRGPFTLWRAVMHASGPYIVPNAKVDGKLVYTNKVFQGSFRGFGNPQIQYAAESNMDELAYKLGLDPLKMRVLNLLKRGEQTASGQLLDDEVGLEEALDRLARESSWNEKRRQNDSRDGVVRGVGVACAWHGISISRGEPDSSSAYLSVRDDGSVDCYTGIVEIGQGTSTGIAQLVSEVIGVRITDVRVHMGTSDAPDTGATHASRGMSVGSIGVLIAAGRLRERLENVASRLLGCEPTQLNFQDGSIIDTRSGRRISIREVVKECKRVGVETSTTGYFHIPKGDFDEERGQGFTYPAFSYMALITEVEVDAQTGETRVVRVWPAVCAGRIINPNLAEAQIHGAFMQGLGYTLTEEFVVSEGQPLTTSFMQYTLPDASNTPQFHTPVFVEDLYRHGPFGAKGVAEMALIPAPAAIANAVRHATGIRFTQLPITKERVFMALLNTQGETNRGTHDPQASQQDTGDPMLE